VRTYLAGEALYSKGQKRAAYQLRAFAMSGEPTHYQAFVEALAAPKAFGLARIVLERPVFERAIGTRFLVQGGLPPQEADLAARFFRAVHRLGVLERPIDTWRAADRNLQDLDLFGHTLRARAAAGLLDAQARAAATRRIDALDARQTELQTRFAAQMSAVARNVRAVAVGAMIAATLIVVLAAAVLARHTARRLRRTEAALRHERGLFRDVALTSSDFIWATDAELRFVYVSDRIQEVTGFARDELVGRRPFELPGCSDHAVGVALRTAMAGREAFQDLECSERDAAGARHWFRLSGTPYWGPDGGFAGYRGTGSEVTGEVTARREADDRRELLETVFAALPVGVGVFDGELRLKAYNAEYFRMLGLPPDFARLGDHFDRFIRYNLARGEYGEVSDPEAFVRARRDLILSREPLRLERTRPDGTVLETRAMPLPSGGGVSVYTDITHHREVETELREARDAEQAANKAKSAFLASMSHELRTPLNAIIGYSEIMAHELLGPVGSPRYQTYATSILTSGQYLHSLIQDVLSLSRLETGAWEPQPAQIPVAGAVQEVLTIQGEAAARRIRCTLEPELAAWADARALKQVLVNVLGNALKFSGAETVDLTAYSSGETAVIEIRDRGPGIPDAELPRVTEPFYTRARSAMTAAGQEEGTGIGLALSKQLTERMGGTLGIESRVGHGTTVRLRLRLHDQVSDTLALAG
jgi:PAS domain S-box-containing protein